MNGIGKRITELNFKRLVIFCLILAAAAAIACTVAVGITYRERLDFVLNYAKLEDSSADVASARARADKLASSSDDVIDVLVLDRSNNVLYSAKGTAADGRKLVLSRFNDEKDYLFSEAYPNAVFRYVKNDEFMLKSVFNTDFSRFDDEYESMSSFDDSLSDKTLYMLSCVNKHAELKFYVVTLPTSVSRGSAVLKASAAAGVFMFCIYWVLVALGMYRDAAKAKLSPVYWGVIGLLSNIAGLVIYKLYKKTLEVCPDCGAAQSSGHLYCTACGAQMGMRCKNCGSKIGFSDRFCHHCGKSLNDDE